jgi:glycosyltransferase involved in cell wall biosynthesis
MKLLVFSHKVCWESPDSKTGWATDGGFSMHMDALALNFTELTIITSVSKRMPVGEVGFTSPKIKIIPLKEWVNPANALLVKIVMPFWFLRYSVLFLRKIISADAVHVPLPSHLGLPAVILSWIIGKRLYVRHCGNWLAPKSFVEKFIKWFMENTPGKRRVYFATGGSDNPPSIKNNEIEWIFSSSMWEAELQQSVQGKEITEGKIKLIHVARQELAKGAIIIVEALPILLKNGFEVSLTIVGEGLGISVIKGRVEELGLEKYVSFTGKLNHEGVLEKLNESTIFCYPTSASEGFPKVVLEAMSLGLPIITTPVSILQTLIPLSGAGLLIERADPILVAERVLYLISNPNAYSLMSLNGITKAKDFTLESWSNKIFEKLKLKWVK